MLDFASPIRQRFCLLETCFASVRTQDVSSFYRRERYRILAFDFRRRELFIRRFRRHCWCDIFIFKRPPKPRLVRASVWSAWLGRRACDASVSASVSVLVSLVVKTKKRILRRRALSLFRSPAPQVVWASLLEEEDTNSILISCSFVASFRSRGRPPCSAPLISVYDVNY